jgi:hypothetical protein
MIKQSQKFLCNQIVAIFFCCRVRFRILRHDFFFVQSNKSLIHSESDASYESERRNDLDSKQIIIFLSRVMKIRHASYEVQRQRDEITHAQRIVVLSICSSYEELEHIQLNRFSTVLITKTVSDFKNSQINRFERLEDSFELSCVRHLLELIFFFQNVHVVSLRSSLKFEKRFSYDVSTIKKISRKMFHRTKQRIDMTNDKIIFYAFDFIRFFVIHDNDHRKTLYKFLIIHFQNE